LKKDMIGSIDEVLPYWKRTPQTDSFHCALKPTDVSAATLALKSSPNTVKNHWTMLGGGTAAATEEQNAPPSPNEQRSSLIYPKQYQQQQQQNQQKQYRQPEAQKLEECFKPQKVSSWLREEGKQCF